MININIKKLKTIFPKQCVISLGDDLFVADVNTNDEFQYPPFRFDGYLAIFCESGNMRLSLDMKEYDLVKNSFSVTLPNNILKLSTSENYVGKVHFVAIALSKEWISKLKLNTNKLFYNGMAPVYVPTIVLTRKEINFTKGYYKIIMEALTANRRYMIDSIASLSSSLFYELAGAWNERIDQADRQAFNGSRNSIKIFNSFVSLVTQYHLTERSVTFYADKLCISSKHLARVIKEVSGHTPTESIDRFVIMEAKNMLMHTTLSIKEIADQLNFSSQTIFYRFFKRHTGMHPSEFRKVSK